MPDPEVFVGQPLDLRALETALASIESSATVQLIVQRRQRGR
ncbi:hypothetical protein [Aeromicrobium sp.]|nr:hypothetical protein [Aeromicrobium sp.]